MGVNGTLDFKAHKKTHIIHHESNPYCSRGLIKAFWSKAMDRQPPAKCCQWC